MYGIKASALYGIITKWCMESIRRKIHANAWCHTARGADYILAHARLHTNPSDWIEKSKSCDLLFSGWGSWIRTSECRSQSPVPYRLAIPLNVIVMFATMVIIPQNKSGVNIINRYFDKTIIFFKKAIDKAKNIWYNNCRWRWCGSMAEQLICNQQVVGSTPITSSSIGGNSRVAKGGRL